jgi:soluble lytic murein transglycosylase
MVNGESLLYIHSSPVTHQFSLMKIYHLLFLLLLGLLAGCGDDPTPTAVAQAVPTFTATPAPTVQLPTVAAGAPTATATITPTLTPTATALPTATPRPEEQLRLGMQLHRYGDYAAARSTFAALLAQTDVNTHTQLLARYELVRAYLADDATGEALATLDKLDQELAKAGAGKDEFSAKAQFLRAEALVGQGEYTKAIALYWQFLESYPWMAEVVQGRIGAAYVAAGDTASAVAAYRRAVDATTDTIAKVRLLEVLAQSASSGADYATATQAYDTILTQAQNPAYRAEIQYLAGQALSSAGDTPHAIERWRSATQEDPTSKNAYTALIELVNRQVDFDLYQRGSIDLQAQAYAPAINAFQEYLDKAAATDSRVAAALHGLGQAYLGAEDYNSALTTLERLLNQFPQCSCFGQATLDKADAQNGLGDSTGARRTYRTFARDHANDPLAPEALWRSGYQALRAGNQVEAAADLLTLVDSFPKSERSPLALYVVALGAYQKGLYAQAADLYSQLQEKYPDYKWDGTAYWRGRAQLAQGDQAAAHKTWQALVERAPDIYYGILAAHALRQGSLQNGALLTDVVKVAGPPSRLAKDDGSQTFAESWLKQWLKSPDPQLSALPPALADDADLRMGRLLLDLDQRGDALVVLARLFARNQDDKRALYPLSLEFERIGVYRLSIVAMQRLLEFSPARLMEETPIFLQRRVYPRHFEDLITQEATANKLNPLLYYSLIRQESMFEEGARSSAAAQGLAQIIPDTGLWVARQLGHPDYTNAIIYRPYLNLKFGAYYLGRVRDDFADGNLVSALVGYNAGPGNIEAWRAISGADDTLFVEILNVNEPRIYVQALTTNLYHYTRLYGQQ